MSLRSLHDDLQKKCPPIPEPIKTDHEDQHYPGYIVQSYDIQVITPIFGGGVEAGINDPVNVIRESSIRGHLRFWWRATRGAACKSIAELRQREGEIWGTTENPSKIGIEADILDITCQQPCAEYIPKRRKPRSGSAFRLQWSWPFNLNEDCLAYTLFPFQGTPPDSKSPQKPAEYISSASFRLTIRTWNELTSDVETALKAWVNFGGVGARTRRGCGALFCRELAPAVDPRIIDEASKGNKLELLRKVIDSWLRDSGLVAKSDDMPSYSVFPLFANSVLISPEVADPIQSWMRIIHLFRKFRQEGIGREPRPDINQRLGLNNLPGRSYWPEPESIRKRAGDEFRGHPRLEEIPDDDFPRSEFGMPIIVHFKPGKPKEPPDTQILPLNGDRMASPLILRPLAICDGDMCLPLIVELNSRLSSEIRVKIGTEDAKPEKALQTTKGLPYYPNSPMRFIGDGKKSPIYTGGILRSFINFAKSKGFAEVGYE